MDDQAVKVENVSLNFKLNLTKSKSSAKSLFFLLSHKILNISERRTFLALDSISFEIQKGELLGIVGRNGAGKTTLARIIAGIYTPSIGRVLVNGKINALFSLGGGFQQNVEFSGRENIYNYCIYQGYSKSTIDRIVGGVIEFSELGDFVDAPMKTYSAGMKGRLIFSMATYLKPDIIILDEVLSAGDPSFQKKAGNILEIFKSHGATIVFISHSIEMIKQHCKRVIWLDNGKIKMDGLSEDVLPIYSDFIGKVKGVVRRIS